MIKNKIKKRLYKAQLRLAKMCYKDGDTMVITITSGEVGHPYTYRAFKRYYKLNYYDIDDVRIVIGGKL